MITNGYLKSTVHAVQRPAPDQDQFDRLALLYLLRLTDDVEIVPAPSPLLKRIGWSKEGKKSTNEPPVRGEGKSSELALILSSQLLIDKVYLVEWIKARVKAYNHRETIESVSEPKHFDYRDLQVQIQY